MGAACASRTPRERNTNERQAQVARLPRYCGYGDVLVRYDARVPVKRSQKDNSRSRVYVRDDSARRLRTNERPQREEAVLAPAPEDNL